MKKTFLALLLATATLPAFADGFGWYVPVEPFVQVAQLTPQERRDLRERWEEVSPEQRVQLRREFQERLRQWGDQGQRRGMRELRGQEGQYNRYGREDDRDPNDLGDNGYGTGYEHRRFEDGRYPSFPQGGFFGNGPDRNGRHR